MKTLLSFASQKPMIPVLGTVQVKDGHALASDLECFIQHPVPGIKDGLYQPHGFNDPSLRILSDISPDDFPDLLALGPQLGELELDVSTLEFVGKAMSSEETRYYLCGVAFFKDAVVALDGVLLNLCRLKAGILTDAAFAGGVIVPREAIRRTIAAAKERKSVRCKLTFFAKGTEIRVGRYLITAMNIDGTYPDYTHVIPEINEKTHRTRFLAPQFEPILETVRTLMKQAGAVLPTLTLYKGTAFYGDHRWPVVTDTKITIGFNTRYMVDAVSGDLYYSDPNSPVRIINEKLGYESVLMPMRF